MRSAHLNTLFLTGLGLVGVQQVAAHLAGPDSFHGKLPPHHHFHRPSSRSQQDEGKLTERLVSEDPFQRQDVLSVNGIRIGYHPDNGDGGGKAQNINEVNDYQGYKSFSIGLYAHVSENEAFDAAELTDLGASLLRGHSGLDPGSVDPSTIDVQEGVLFQQVVDSGAVLIATVMPVLSWAGLTQDNNTQAVRIAQSLKRFTDAGVTTWLRFAHEANYYNSDDCHEAPGGGKVYVGGPEDVKEGWAVVAQAVAGNAPEVKMYWSPNLSNLRITVTKSVELKDPRNSAGSQEDIDRYAPDDLSTIDIVGIDWYPETANASLADSYQWLHDKYCSDDVPFTVGETSIHQPLQARQQHFETWTSEAEVARLPYFKVITWFNFNKDADGACESGCEDQEPLRDMIAGKDCDECDRDQVRQFFASLADF